MYTKTEIIVGVAGPTASGKSIITSTIAKRLGDLAAILSYDAYYHDLSHLPLEIRNATDFDCLDALDVNLLIQHLQALREGNEIHIPYYDFVEHTRLPQGYTLSPRKIVFVEGIFVLAEPLLRTECNYKVYVDASERQRLSRRITRDVQERGWTEAQVCTMWENLVRPSEQSIIEPSRRYADFILNNDAALEVSVDSILQAINSESNLATYREAA